MNIAIIFAAALILCSCQTEAHKCIKTLPAGYSIDSLSDCRVPASFNVEDINWRGNNLAMNVFAENLYDMVEISQMQKGDTLMYDGIPMIVESVVGKDGAIEVNGGIEEGGAWLTPYEGGTYRATQFDDHSVYTSLGKKELMISDDFSIVDCGENPQDSIITITENQKEYLEALPESRQTFSELDTKVLIENGVVTAIQRIWIP